MDLTERRAILFCFILGFAVRLVPEIISYPYPIGWDTIGYAASISTGKIFYHSEVFFTYPWNSVFSTWLLYLFLIPIKNALNTDPFILLKLTSPILYAANVFAVYFFSRKWLCWSINKSLLAGFVFAIQLASLRISWDLYRNFLAMIFLLLALPLVVKADTKKGLVVLGVVSLLVVFSHELVAAVFFTIVFGSIVVDVIKRQVARKHLKILLAIVPALTVFIFMTFTVLFHVGYAFEPNIISAQNTPSFHPFNLFFIENYLTAASPMENYPSYFSLVTDVFGLFGILYLVWLPLIIFGFFRDKILNIFTLILFTFTFNALIIPFFAIFQWSRWMYLLVYPFTFYAANGAAVRSRSLFLRNKAKKLGFLRSFSRLSASALSIAIVFAFLFMVPPLDYGVFSLGSVNTYLPVTMQYNTIPLRDQNDLIKTIEWLNVNGQSNASLLVHHSLLSWTRLYLSNDFVKIYYISSADDAANLAFAKGFAPIYLIWWNTDFGWNGIIVPNHFHSVFASGRLSVFQYQ